MCYNFNKQTFVNEVTAVEKQRLYIAIDLKSFYASQECVDRGLDPLTTHLVVADSSRTVKTICLAVTPSLKAEGVPSRPRLFEVVERVKAVNASRASRAPGRRLEGASCQAPELAKNPSLALDYIVAPPRMAAYMAASARVYGIYLKYIAPEDIHVYSVDEVFMDVTGYLKIYRMTPEELARKMILEVLHTTGITATAGIGTNLYLCKVAMDIEAKKMPPDANGVRIASLTELSYRQRLWEHRPLTDFWRVGTGYRRKLERRGMFTMGDVARCSLNNPKLLYTLFGINAQLLIDHAWGWESCTMADIKSYRPLSNSLSSGQVLCSGHSFHLGRLIFQEMADQLALELAEKELVTDQLVIHIGYDRENLEDPEIARAYQGQIVLDHYGRPVPKSAHGSINLGRHTASTREIVGAATQIYDRAVEKGLLVRRLNITANHVLPGKSGEGEQLDLFTLAAGEDPRRESRRQEAVNAIRHRFGKNAILKGMNLQEGATAIQRNRQIGGHRA